MIQVQERARQQLEASINDANLTSEQLEAWALNPVTNYVLSCLSLEFWVRSDDLISPAQHTSDQHIASGARHLAGYQNAIEDIEANIAQFLGKTEVDEDE